MKKLITISLVILSTFITGILSWFLYTTNKNLEKLVDDNNSLKLLNTELTKDIESLKVDNLRLNSVFKSDITICKYTFDTNKKNFLSLIPLGSLIKVDNIPLFISGNKPYDNSKYQTYLAGSVKTGIVNSEDVSLEPYYIGVYKKYDIDEDKLIDSLEPQYVFRFIQLKEKIYIFDDHSSNIEIITNGTIKLQEDTDDFIFDPEPLKSKIELNTNVVDETIKDFSELNCMTSISVSEALFGPAGNEIYWITGNSRVKYAVINQGHKPIEEFSNLKKVDTYKNRDIFKLSDNTYIIPSLEGLALELQEV